MGEMNVSVTSISDSHGNQLGIHSDGKITTSGVPEEALPYGTLIADTLGVVAANNFLSVFNPAGSGKTLYVLTYRVYPWATAATSVTVSMGAWRTSAASGGTLLAASNINKFNTTQPNSVAEVRTGNPTCTLVGTVPIVAIPPAIASGASGAGVTASIEPPSGTLFAIRPGEGVVCRTASGSVGQLWNISLSWYEM